jgi:two-component sensor histidine kinase
MCPPFFQKFGLIINWVTQKRTKTPKLVILTLCIGYLLTARHLLASQATNALEIQSVTVNGNFVRLLRNGNLSLGSFPKNIVFGFGPGSNSMQAPLRIRHKLEGYDNNWQDENGVMFLSIRFFDDSGDLLSQKSWQVSGESAGWNGSLISSALTHRREMLTVPSHVSRLMVVISSAGPPSTVGIYVVDNLVVSKSSDSLPSVVLIQSPFKEQPYHDITNQPSGGWMRDGVHPSMARIVKFGQHPEQEAFAIMDDDRIGHAEWHNPLDVAPKVTPGDRLVVEWNEMYSIGGGGGTLVEYNNLPPGNYQFHVEGVDIMGIPTGVETSLNVFVPQPYWRMPWFWGAVCIVIVTAALGANRYLVWHRMRRVMLQLKNQQELERERLRIAHDIHDDLGARVTQISLLSAMSQDNPTFPEKARADFDQISQMSRELVSALYQTVWAVNPENDNLDALGNYLCQTVNQMCERTQIRCRFHMLDLSREVPVSSQTRHNISMAVKEAVHNVIKHAKASEVSINVTFDENLLTVSVQDNGCGFQPSGSFTGNGLTNMKRRLEDLGGSCIIESQPGHGTTVRMRLIFRPSTKIT